MSKELIDKKITYNQDHVIITEQTRLKLNKNQLEEQLLDVQRQKSRLQEHNARLIFDYNELSKREEEIRLLINSLVVKQIDELEEI